MQEVRRNPKFCIFRSVISREIAAIFLEIAAFRVSQFLGQFLYTSAFKYSRRKWSQTARSNGPVYGPYAGYHAAREELGHQLNCLAVWIIVWLEPNFIKTFLVDVFREFCQSGL